MQATRRMTALVVIALVAVFCLVATTAAAEEKKKLYPACDSREYTASAGMGKETVVQSIYFQYRALALECLAYEVTSLKGGQKNQDEDYCLIQHQTEYAYSLVLRGAYTNEDGNTVTRDFSIRDMTGGSLAEVTARMPQLSSFSVVFKNLANDSRCNLRIRALITLSDPGWNLTSDVVPTVVAVEPRTVFTKDSPRTYVVLDYGEGQTPSRSDSLTLVDYTLGTCDAPGGDVKSMDYAASIPATVHVPADARSYSARMTTFSDPNTYRVCFRADGAKKSYQIAVLTAFSGNPAYYEITSGLDDEGRVSLEAETTIKFYGYDLDTRKGGDQAKFVWFSEECDSGEPAGGVPLADDLGPEDNYGPNTTYSLWVWKLKSGGSFKVCYKRKATGKWTEVPSIDDVGPGNEKDDSAPTSVPTPTDPTTKEKCPTLEYDPRHRWEKYKSVQLTLKSSKVPDDFFSTLSRLLCVKRSTILVTHNRKNKAGKQEVFVSLDCEDDECDETERLNYLVEMAEAKLSESGITAAVGSTAMFAYDDNEVVEVGKRSSVALVFVGLCVLGGGGMALLAVSRYQERRHHFTQFGLDEDDIDDMYDFNVAPAPAARNHYDVSGAPEPPVRINNAVIEIEE